MARPYKSGLDYFPLDTVFDTKMELIQAEFGVTGLMVVIMLWQKIYSEHGYYCEWTDEVALLFARKMGLGGNVVSEIIRACIKRGIFDKRLYKQYSILTSKGVQKRYFAITSRRIGVSVKDEYLLVSYTPKTENVCNNEVNVCKNEVNDAHNAQSKVNKRESKVNDIKQKPYEKASYTYRKNAFSDYASDGYFNDFDIMNAQMEQK